MPVPRWAVEIMLSNSPRLCAVCTGESPARDGHDAAPGWRCRGAARQALADALAATPKEP